ncbi:MULTISPECIES: ADP-ribosylglycohydrolase family protein [Nostocales]|uniref:ADP-ribosylglycohydrolase family protein n=3 Tax=Nostocales TaxID=1161 RepID=A0A8S9T296_9CYAN|nr:ADP-ribosylglycohydrolase family protein [Tolypothrix bouteillei]KAF3886198.1 ADP-ribosylglycohydrolase family protein [Tolypothrix bouteillei VB521301]
MLTWNSYWRCYWAAFGRVISENDSAQANHTAALFAAQCKISSGISGYVYHTVPVVVQVWLRHQRSYRDAIEEIVRLGGDTDTTAAIVGGIIGAGVGTSGLPKDWLNSLYEYPRTVEWMKSLGERLFEVSSSGKNQLPLPLSIPGLLVRNVLFLLIVLGHGFRRLLPPY